MANYWLDSIGSIESELVGRTGKSKQRQSIGDATTTRF
jgi:hypothetical protein